MIIQIHEYRYMIKAHKHLNSALKITKNGWKKLINVDVEDYIQKKKIKKGVCKKSVLQYFLGK